ncbi:MAG: 50S ribosomal protein L25/general stress protein Ctc [Betaproteobacteria bacterium]|nr:50S ribosomal protein L25/general stress protein Ctc [Betaproteobacteria bacterium]
MKFELNAQKRTTQGSGASRRLRSAGKVPGILYGKGNPAVAIEVDHNTLLLSLRKEAFHSSIITLDLDGVKESVLLRDCQRHPYKLQVLHVDFQRVAADEKLHQKVPLHFINADIAPGVKLSGGMISHVVNEIDISCLPADLPAFIEIDLQHLAAGQSIHLEDIKLPNGVSVVIHGQENPLIATVVAKKGEESEEAAAEATPAAGTAAS